MNPISLLVLAMTVTAQFCPLRGGSGGSGGIVHLGTKLARRHLETFLPDSSNCAFNDIHLMMYITSQALTETNNVAKLISSGFAITIDVRRKALFIKEIGASQGFQPKMSWIGANGTRLVRQARSPEISLSYH
ncbi:hypothetical protein L13192_11717 [Pyrenophora tritici-repentis]|nr:hypothetical protein L13192_11717 [Pyrenophora tritici-repentis]